jgi:hypothetical protein
MQYLLNLIQIHVHKTLAMQDTMHVYKPNTMTTPCSINIAKSTPSTQQAKQISAAESTCSHQKGTRTLRHYVLNKQSGKIGDKSPNYHALAFVDSG